jgi:hypothetical protein
MTILHPKLEEMLAKIGDPQAALAKIRKEESEAIKIIKASFPKMRRTGSTAIVHSGGKRTIFKCLCGSRHTTSTEWNGRKAKHVTDWQSDHVKCAAVIAAKLQAGECVTIDIEKE